MGEASFKIFELYFFPKKLNFSFQISDQWCAHCTLLRLFGQSAESGFSSRLIELERVRKQYAQYVTYVTCRSDLIAFDTSSQKRATDVHLSSSSNCPLQSVIELSPCDNKLDYCTRNANGGGFQTYRPVLVSLFALRVLFIILWQ